MSSAYFHISVYVYRGEISCCFPNFLKVALKFTSFFTFITFFGFDYMHIKTVYVGPSNHNSVVCCGWQILWVLGWGLHELDLFEWELGRIKIWEFGGQINNLELLAC